MKHVRMTVIFVLMASLSVQAKTNRSPNQNAETARADSAAQSRIGAITQIFRDTMKAVVQIDPNVVVDDLKSVIVPTMPGEACEAKVLSLKPPQLLIQFVSCSTFESIKANAPVNRDAFAEASPAPEVQTAEKEVVVQEVEVPVQGQTPKQATPPPAKDDSRPKFTISLGYHNGTKLNYDDMTYTTGGTTYTGKYSFDLDSAFHVALGLMLARKFSWGFYSGLSRETKRTLKGETLTIDGGGTASLVYTSGNPTVTFTLIEANAIYRWDQFYIPFGLNYSIVDFTTGDVPATTTVRASGALGGQLGLGFFANDKIHFEFYSQVISNTLTINTSTEIANLNTGLIAGLMARVGFDF